MRVNCPHCGGKAVITSREQLTPNVADLYCRCADARHCSASFVFKLSYSHDTNPPIKVTAQLAMALIKNLSPGERDKLKQVDLFQN